MLTRKQDLATQTLVHYLVVDYCYSADLRKVFQTIISANSLFSGMGSYPGEGGYIYYNPTGDLLYCYQFGYDGSGNPLFTLAGKSASTFAGKSVPTITSLNGQASTAIVSNYFLMYVGKYVTYLTTGMVS
jgi:hypothetical protein